MKPGKVSETIYKRSILRYIKDDNWGDSVKKIFQRSEVGVDACVHQPSGDLCPVTSVGTVTLLRRRIGAIALYRAVNSLAAMGAFAKSVWVNMLLPDWFMESHLKGVMEEIRDTAAELGIGIAGVYAEVVLGLLSPVLTVSAYGEVRREDLTTPKRIQEGMDLVMTKDAGTEGAVIMALEREEELLRRFTPSFVDQVQNLFCKISAVGEAAVAVKHGVKAMHHIGEGGVFGALWEMAEAAELGLEVELKKIPILQETVEVCECFHVNPYQIPSAGSLIMAAADGSRLAEELRREGFCAAVIGRMTPGKERLLLQEEERRFLEPPKMNELWKGLTENQIGGLV